MRRKSIGKARVKVYIVAEVGLPSASVKLPLHKAVIRLQFLRPSHLTS